MAEERGVVKYEARDGQQVTLSFETIKKYLVQGKSEFVTQQEMMYFMGICKSRGLNPFIKDCYLIKYSQNEGAAIITSIDYFRKRAKAQKDCKGWKKGIIVERNGEIIYSNGLILEGDTLLGGWFRAQPAGWEEPFELEVNLKGYIKRTREGVITKFWAPENQPTQIMKVAESQGLRTVWSDEFQQLYTLEEMGEPDAFKQAEIIIEEAKDTTGDLTDKLKQEAPEPIKPPQASQDAPQSTKSPDPEQEAKDPFREEWINLRGAGFATYVHTHLEELRTLSPEDLQEIKAKWAKLYDKTPWPLDLKEEKPIINQTQGFLNNIHGKNTDENARRLSYLDNCHKAKTILGNEQYYAVLAGFSMSSMNSCPNDPEAEEKVLTALHCAVDQLNAE